MAIYRFQPLVREHSELFVLGVGRKVGVTTRVLALQHSAESAGIPLDIRSANISDLEVNTTELCGGRPVLLICRDAKTMRPVIEDLFSTYPEPVYVEDIQMAPSYSEEMEFFIARAPFLLLSLVELLPPGPEKDQFLLLKDAIYS